MLDEHRIADLKLLYQLISRNGIEQFNGTEQLKKAYSEYIKVRQSLLLPRVLNH